MPHRDPETGKFVSGSGGMRDLRADMDTVTGAISYRIPAADNAGGETSQEVNGEEAELIDFTGVLDDDETFRIQAMSLTVALSLPTTSTAEGWGSAAWQLRTDFGNASPSEVAGRLDGAQREEGIIDVVPDQREESDIIEAGVVTAEASHSDTVTGVGAGGHHGYDHRYFRPAEMLGAVVTVDEDDELSIPTLLRTENVSDHRIVFGATLVCYGNEVRN